MGKVEGEGHRLKTDGVIIHAHRGEGDGVEAFVRCPMDSCMDSVENM
jgi:hypothetical protein